MQSCPVFLDDQMRCEGHIVMVEVLEVLHIHWIIVLRELVLEQLCASRGRASDGSSLESCRFRSRFRSAASTYPAGSCYCIAYHLLHLEVCFSR
jgi:hypothetical protein